MTHAEPPAAPSMICAASIVDELAALGVAEVVCCPGSRSAPLAYAAHAADLGGRLRLHMRVDERTAGFTALGLAKASGRPAAVITTSGTAAGNLLPAVMEARHAGVPLVVVTADRPSTLVGTGANQTTDQVGLLVPVVASARLAAEPVTIDGWRSAVRRLVTAATGALSAQPGPVHLNVELSAPLIGTLPTLPRRADFTVTARSEGQPLLLEPGPHTVIVAGDLPVEQGRHWARAAARADIPLLAEPSSNARSGRAAIAGYRLLGGLYGDIERVIVVGHPTLSRPVTALLSRRDVELVVVTRHAEWIDPGWAASTVVRDLTLPDGDPAWLDRWVRADGRLASRMDDLVGTELNGPVVAREVWRTSPVLVIGSSNPIRDADLTPIASRPPVVYANRGLAGIDGTLATARGIGLGAREAVTVLVGDLTAVHDLTSLAIPPGEPATGLRVVIADDGGGSIFAGLEYGAPASDIGGLAAGFERLFAVPSGVDLAAAARGLGATVTEVSTVDGLRAALGRGIDGVEVVVARISRAGRRDLGERLLAAGVDASA